MLVFCSKPGIGKTYLCAALSDWAANKFPYARYYTEKDLLSRLRKLVGEEKGEWAGNLEYMTDDELIMLDDVGSWWNDGRVSNRDHEWRIEVFFHFLDYRYSRQLPTIITSNLTPSQFKEVYSERISSRLFAKENTLISIFDETPDKRSLGL